MLAAASNIRRTTLTEHGDAPVVLDISGRRVELTRAEAERLQFAAPLDAGRSSVARDLSVLLQRSLAGAPVLALRRNEAQALTRLAEAVGLADPAARLSATR